VRGRLVGVGVGPGDPELLTLKALRVLREARTVFVPTTPGSGTGRAEAVVTDHVPSERVVPLAFAMSDTRARESNWEQAATKVVASLRYGGTTAFATLGDPNLYSTFTHLCETVRRLLPELTVETVPGITAMQALAAHSGTVLAEGSERLTLLPLTGSIERLREALCLRDTVVCYKAGSRLPEVLKEMRAAGRLESAIYGAWLGMDGELICSASDMLETTGPYLSTVIVPASRGTRRAKL
jgi:precorrin-2/cobalt-factor-2 C20-methyltransferase